MGTIIRFLYIFPKLPSSLLKKKKKNKAFKILKEIFFQDAALLMLKHGQTNQMAFHPMILTCSKSCITVHETKTLNKNLSEVLKSRIHKNIVRAGA